MDIYFKSQTEKSTLFAQIKDVLCQQHCFMSVIFMSLASIRIWNSIDSWWNVQKDNNNQPNIIRYVLLYIGHHYKIGLNRKCGGYYIYFNVLDPLQRLWFPKWTLQRVRRRIVKVEIKITPNSSNSGKRAKIYF